MSSLLNRPLHVVNVGLERFAQPLEERGTPVTVFDWRPPAGNNPALAWQLARLLQHPLVDNANAKAYERYLSAVPVLEGVGMAGETIPNMTERMLLHSGPPVAWEEMCGPQQGAVIGAILFESWADTPEEARKMAEKGEIALESCHDHQAVGPMAGVISPSMPVWIVRNTVHDNLAYSNFNEGLGKVLRFGAYDADVLNRLRWMRDVLGPVLDKAIRHVNGVELKPLMAQALQMGDEVHNRNAAATSLLFRKLAPAALEVEPDGGRLTEIFAFIAGNDHFFLNISMAACKAMLDAAAGVAHSTLVTAMSRNGVRFGIRIAALPDQWFEAPSPEVNGLFFPGYGPADAARDLGDSAITETAGLGGFAMAAAPAIVQFVGGSVQDARDNSRLMTHITLGRNSAFTLPMLDFAPTAAGIDIRKVVDTGILPVINTGIAHKEAGIGQVGAGVTHAPLECFLKALAVLAATVPLELEHV